MLARQFTILPPLSFIADALAEAKNAKKRIYIQAMEIEQGEIADHFLNILNDGVEKGLDTKVHVDHYSFLVTDGVFNYLPVFSKEKAKERNNRLQRRKDYFKNLSQQGVKVTYTNPPSIITKVFPMFGRNHIKMTIIDDNAYIGGINYHDLNFKSNDCMVKLTDPDIVNHIVLLFDEIEKKALKKDKKITCTDDTYLLVDSGKVGKSLILDEATRLVNEARSSVDVITPIIPDTHLLKALAKAKKRGVVISITVPAIRKMKGIYFFLDSFNQLILSFQKRDLAIRFKNYPIHTKMMIVDEKKVLLGSHNLTNRGVLMGTEELAIVSTHPHFVSQALSFINHSRDR